MTNDGAEPEEPIGIVIPREAVESCDTEQVLMGPSVLVRCAALAPRARGKLQLAFDGFDRDPRELWQIRAVRRFVSRLDEVFPYWFFLADAFGDGVRTGGLLVSNRRDFARSDEDQCGGSRTFCPPADGRHE